MLSLKEDFYSRPSTPKSITFTLVLILIPSINLSVVGLSGINNSLSCSHENEKIKKIRNPNVVEFK